VGADPSHGKPVTTSVPGNAVIEGRVHAYHPKNLKILKDKAPFSDSNCCKSAENCCHSGESADPSHDRPVITSVPANAVIKERLHADHPENLKIPKDKAPFSDSNCCQSAENCCHSGESADPSHGRPVTTSVPGNAVIKERPHAYHPKNLKILKDKAPFSDSNCCQSAENCCHSGVGADTSHGRPVTTSVPGNAVIEGRIHAYHPENLKILKDKAPFNYSNCCKSAENCCHSGY